MAKDKWMQDAVPKKNKGLFTKKAKKAGKTVAEYAKEKKNSPGKLGKEARFAATATKIAKGKKK